MRPIAIVQRAALCAVLLFAAAGGCKGGKPKALELRDEVEITADENGFSPSVIAGKRGKPLTLVITRTSNKTCATEIVIPDEKINTTLPLDVPTRVTVIPSKPGTLRFACGMNMFKGEIQVQP